MPISQNNSSGSSSIVKSRVEKTMLIAAVLYLYVSNAFAQDATKVDVIYPEPFKQSQSIRLPGTVVAKQHAQLASLESGRVVSLNAEVGDNVKAGDELLRLESQLAQLQVAGAAAEVKAAELNLAEADRLYEEVKRLSAQKVVAKTLIAERAALLANAEVELARVKANHNLQQERLKRHRLKAPFDGVIARRNIDLGEWVTPQNAAFTLVAQNDLRLSIEIPQQHYNRIKNSKKVTVKVIPDTAGLLSFDADLSRLVPVSNNQTRTFAAQIDLPESQKTGLVTGMSAVAVLTFADGVENTVLLPRSVIKQHPDGNSSVFVVENNRAKRIVTNYTNAAGGQVAINGYDENLPFIITGVELLIDGAQVEINAVKGSPQ